MRKRTFSAEFKAKIVLEVLKGEKEISVIASENEIAPNQIRNWKNEFLANAANAFDNKKADKIKGGHGGQVQCCQVKRPLVPCLRNIHM
ncbi:MAG: transposase [Clostridia bacterium]